MGILLPAPQTSRPMPLHCRSAEAKMRRGNLSGELHRALGFLLLLVLVLSPPMRQEGARAGARARVRLDRGRRPFCTVCLSRAPAADRASDAQASVARTVLAESGVTGGLAVHCLGGRE